MFDSHSDVFGVLHFAGYLEQGVCEGLQPLEYLHNKLFKLLRLPVCLIFVTVLLEVLNSILHDRDHLRGKFLKFINKLDWMSTKSSDTYHGFLVKLDCALILRGFKSVVCSLDHFLWLVLIKFKLLNVDCLNLDNRRNLNTFKVCFREFCRVGCAKKKTF